MKKIIVAALFILNVLFLSTSYSAGEEILLKLPVKVLLKDKAVETLTKDDFELSVNGKKEKIVEFFKRNRSLSQPAVRRNFILAFNITEYGKQISNGISHFVSHILAEGDSIILWSPVKVYRIATHKGKKNVLQEIETIVKKDTLRYKKNIAGNISNLSQLIRRFDRGGSEFFLISYKREFNNFKNRFLLAGLAKNQAVAALLAEEEGEKWLINFQEREIIPFIAEFRKIAREIRDYAGTLSGTDQPRAATFYNELNMIEKSMMISETFPVHRILDAMLAVNINYNVIFFKNQKKSTGMGDTVSPDYEKTLKDVSICTGGIAVINSNLSKSLDIIGKNSSVFYELTFKTDDKLEDKTIEVGVSKARARLYYKKLFPASEIKAHVSAMKETRIKLSGISLKRQVLKFSISGYKLDKDTQGNKMPGIIKILVLLLDDKNVVVYRTQNTLKSQKKSISISLKLPVKTKGNFRVRISAFDFIAGKIAHELHESEEEK